MKKTILQLVICFLLMITSLIAQVEKDPMLLLEYPQIEIENKSFYIDQINKLIIQSIAKHRGYEPVFANNTLAMKSNLLNRLIVNIKKTKVSGLFHMEISQNSGKSGKPIRQSWALNVPERFLLLQVRLSIIEALYGKALAKEEKELMRKKDVSFKEYLDAKEKTPANETSPSSDTQEDKKVKKKSKGNKKSESSLKSGFSETDTLTLLSSLETNIPFDQIEELLAKNPDNIYLSIMKIRKQNLQKEIEDIQNVQREVRSSLAMKTPIKNSADSNEESSAKSSDNKNESINYATNQISQDRTGPKAFEKEMRPRTQRNLFELVYLDRVLTTSYIINVSNSLNFVGPRFTHRRNLSEVSGDDLVFSIMNLKAVGVSDVQYAIPDVRNAHVQYLSSLTFLPFDFFLGMHYENQFFINLPELNKGLKVSENHLVWIQAGAERVFKIKNIMTVLQAFYAKNIFSKSDFLENKDVKLDGNRLSAGAEMTWRKWSLGFQYSKDIITSDTLSDFKINQTSYFINLAYYF